MMAIEPVVENVIEITHPGSMLVLIGKNDVLPLTAEGDPLPLEKSSLLPASRTLSPTGYTPETTGQTLSPAGYTLSPTGDYSKITTKTTTKITTTTANTDNVDNEELSTDNNTKSGGSGDRLIFDFALANWKASRRQQAEKTLEKLDLETAQTVLDELNESMAAGKVKQPLPWLRKVAERAYLGEFEPTNEMADRRETELRQQKSAALKARAKPSQLWKDHMADLKAQFDDDDFNRNIVPLRGLERGEILLLQAPNKFVKDWVEQRIEVIRDVIGAHTDNTPDIRISVG
jgi:hypothetical protein